MRSSAVSRTARLFLAGALLATLAACGSSGDSTRQRNGALECDVMVDGTVPPGCDPSESEKKIDCEAQWDPTTGVLTLCEKFSRVDVKQKNSKGKAVGNGEQVAMTDNTLTVVVADGVKKLDFKVWTLNPAGELREAGSVEFEADTTASKTFSFKPNAETSSSTTTPEIDRQLVFGYDLHEVGQSVNIESVGVALTKKTKAELKVEYRLNGVSPESNVLTVTLKAYDSSDNLLATETKNVDATKNADEKTREWTELETTLKGDFMVNTARIAIALTGKDGAANSGGQAGPRVTSVELKIGDRVINGNPQFDDWTAIWNVVGRSFAQCSLTNGAVPCVTDAPFESAFAAGTIEEETTTTTEAAAEETTTTVEETTTTVAAAEETTTTTGAAAEETTTTVEEGPMTVQTIAPPLLVPREDCSFGWNAEARTFTACRSFRAIKVGVFGADGRYVGSASSENSDTVTLDAPLAASMRFAYYSLGRELLTDKGSLVLSQAREWMTITDPTKDVSDAFIMDSTENPTIREEGEPELMSINPNQGEKKSEVEWEINGNFMAPGSLVLEVNGSRNVNAVTVPVDDVYRIRVYSTNEFGFLDYVAGGTTSSIGDTVNLQAQFLLAGGLGLVKVNTETESAGFVEPGEFVEGDIEECAGAQPILYTSPNSPSRSNRVTISLDADCSSVNGVLAVAVVRLDLFDESGDFTSSVAWWNVSSTRYSSRMTETIYLPDGKYSIFFFNPDTYFIKGIDYRVDAGGKDDACKEMSLRIDEESGLAVVEGCDALAGIEAIASPLKPGSFDSNDESMETDPDVTTVGAAIELASVPDGWWNIMVIDKQQSAMGGLFALCARACDIQTDGNNITVDTSALASKGTVEAADSGCDSMNDRSENLDNPYFSEAMVAFVQSDADHAPRAAWVDGNVLQDNETITGKFTARFDEPGASALLATWCSVDGTAKTEGDPDTYVNSGLTRVDVSSAPRTVAANDKISDAVDITGAAEVTLQQFGATLDSDEPLAGFSSFLFDRSLITTTWLKFTAPTTSRMRLALPEYDTDGFDPLTTGITVYRQNDKGQLGFVTTNMSLAQLAWMELIDDFSDVEPALSDLAAQEFNVQENTTYYVQVVGLSFLDHPKTLSISNVDRKAWSEADIEKVLTSTTVGEDGPTTTNENTITSDAPSTSDSPTTTSGSDVVEPPVTSTEPKSTTTAAPNTTVAPNTTTAPNTTAAPDTTSPSASGNTVAPDTTAASGNGTTTTVVPPTSQKIAEGMMNLIENGSRNETLPVLAGSGVPTVEAREDAVTVTIGMADLVASVSKAGAEVNPQSRIVITTKNGRHVRVSQKLKSVTVPVAGYFGNQDLKVSAYGTDGKKLTSTITVKKSLAPLVKVKVAGNSMTGRIIALVVLLLLAILIYLFTRHARKSGAAA